jgi:hypothetical protein
MRAQAFVGLGANVKNWARDWGQACGLSPKSRSVRARALARPVLVHPYYTGRFNLVFGQKRFWTDVYPRKMAKMSRESRRKILI